MNENAADQCAHGATHAAGEDAWAVECQQDDLIHTARNDAERLLRSLTIFLDLARLDAEKATSKSKKYCSVDDYPGYLSEVRKRATDRG